MCSGMYVGKRVFFFFKISSYKVKLNKCLIFVLPFNDKLLHQLLVFIFNNLQVGDSSHVIKFVEGQKQISARGEHTSHACSQNLASLCL